MRKNRSVNPETMIDASDPETLADLAGQRALNLFEARRLCCAEAVLLTLNNGFDGGLTEKEVLALGAGFCGGIGDAGCICGSLSGAVAGLGLFLAPHLQNGLAKKIFRAVCKEMHDRFTHLQGTACCRELCRPHLNDRKGLNTNCGGLTAHGAAIAARLLLEQRPRLARSADIDFLKKRDTRLGRLLRGGSS